MLSLPLRILFSRVNISDRSIKRNFRKSNSSLFDNECLQEAESPDEEGSRGRISRRRILRPGKRLLQTQNSSITPSTIARRLEEKAWPSSIDRLSAKKNAGGRRWRVFVPGRSRERANDIPVDLLRRFSQPAGSSSSAIAVSWGVSSGLQHSSFSPSRQTPRIASIACAREKTERCHGTHGLFLGDPWKRYSLYGHWKRGHELQSHGPWMFSEGNIWCAQFLVLFRAMWTKCR